MKNARRQTRQNPLSQLRKRLEKSETLARIIAAPIAGYIWFCNATTKWDKQGFDALDAALSDGPVIMISWHSRIMMEVPHLPTHRGGLSIPRDNSPAGMLSGAIQRWFGLRPYAMNEHKSNLAASRDILRQFSKGISLGLTGDGPVGPARELRDPPLEWARMTGLPVFVMSISTRRQRRMNTWDQMLWPLPFSRGATRVERWQGSLDRKATPEQIEAARADLSALMDKVQADCDTAIGLPPGP